MEQARPTTSGEEELQLQLALAMSREESEKVALTKITHRARILSCLDADMLCSHARKNMYQTYKYIYHHDCYVMVVKCYHYLPLLGGHFPDLLAESDIINSVCDVVNNGTWPMSVKEELSHWGVRKLWAKEWEARQDVHIDPLQSITCLLQSLWQGQPLPSVTSAQLVWRYIIVHESLPFCNQSNQLWFWDQTGPDIFNIPSS